MMTHLADLDHLMETLEKASNAPDAVSIGEFAKAVQSIQAELRMLEGQIDQLGDTVDSAFGNGTAQIVPEASATGPLDHAAANKP